MTTPRYDSIAEGYARWWAPVIRPAAEALLDHLWSWPEPGTTRLLDAGTGTGTLAVAALERWPSLRVTGVDVSSEMLALAARSAAERLPAGARSRFTTEVADVSELPFADEAFDAAMSSFVLQLVPSRAAALREIRRVLRPGGTFGWVTWRRSRDVYEPDRVANEVLDEAGFDPPEPDGRSGDLASAAAAALAMRRAGFGGVHAQAAELEHRWDVDDYVAFFTRFDEASLFDDLEPAERDEIAARIRERVASLDASAMTLRLPVVYVTGRAR
jgi:SAM-dependent methyltransferase